MPSPKETLLQEGFSGDELRESLLEGLRAFTPPPLAGPPPIPLPVRSAPAVEDSLVSLPARAFSDTRKSPDPQMLEEMRMLTVINGGPAYIRVYGALDGVPA